MNSIFFPARARNLVNSRKESKSQKGIWTIGISMLDLLYIITPKQTSAKFAHSGESWWNFTKLTHHWLYQASCPNGDGITIPSESAQGQHQLQQHISQPSKFLVRTYAFGKATSAECNNSVPQSNLWVWRTSWILRCSASQLSLDRFEAICNGWILDWKKESDQI